MLSRGIDNINNVPLSVNNIYTVFNIDGNTLRLGVYTGAAGSSPSDRILTFNQLLERTGSPIDTTIADETTPKPIDVANPDSSTNPLPASPAIPGLANVWYTGDSGVFGVEWRTYMTFSDRRTSRDFPTIISQGRAVSEHSGTQAVGSRIHHSPRRLSFWKRLYSAQKPSVSHQMVCTPPTPILHFQVSTFTKPVAAAAQAMLAIIELMVTSSHW